jgi:peptide/nickel transport system substrate-binding protein
MKLRGGALAAPGVVLALVLAGCTTPTEPSGSEDVAVVFSNIAQTPTLDPHIAFGSDGLLFVRQAYDSLLEYEPGGIDVQPALATDWEVSADGLTFTVTLREGATFHDGSAVDAEAVRTSVERLLAINQGPATVARGIGEVAAPDERTVVFTLTQPDAYFPGVLPKLPIVSARAIEEHRTADDPWAEEWFGTNEAGSGPYVLTSLAPTEIRLEAYRDYWREFATGTPTTVTLRTDPDVTTAVQLMCQGQVDMIGGIGTDQTDQAAACDGVKTIEQTQYGVRTVFFHQHADGPVADVRVRRAIALAFDYQSYWDYFKGRASPATGPLPPHAGNLGPGYPEIHQDLDGARRLLADAGYPDGGFSVSYLGISGLAFTEFFGTLLQQNLEALGITLEQTYAQWPQVVSLQGDPESAHDLAFLSLSMITNDPTSMLKSGYVTDSWASGGGYNWAYYSDETVDTLTGQVSSVQDEAQRAEMIHQVIGQIIEDQVAMWLMLPSIYQPVRDTWDVSYEPMDSNVMVRFFFARQVSS